MWPPSFPILRSSPALHAPFGCHASFATSLPFAHFRHDGGDAALALAARAAFHASVEEAAKPQSPPARHLRRHAADVSSGTKRQPIHGVRVVLRDDSVSDFSFSILIFYFYD